MSIAASLEPALAVRDLRAGFTTPAGRVRAVRGVDLEIRRGERVGLVGESGCGKTAFALAIAGLLDAPGSVESGDVLVAGKQVSSATERELRRIRGNDVGFVFQDALTALDPVKTVGKQITESLRAHARGMSRPVARRRAIELLHEVGIQDAPRRINDYPHQFSGGMRQRVLIAMAIANEPQLLIADEPTTALDVTTQAQVLGVLARMSRDHHCAVLLITHDLGVVAGFCESVCVMYAGRIVERAQVDAIFRRPLHPYTESLLQAIPQAGHGRRRLPEIAGSPPDLISVEPGCSFEPRCFLGHGKEQCIAHAPLPARVRSRAGAGSVECHFASERAAVDGGRG